MPNIFPFVKYSTRTKKRKDLNINNKKDNRYYSTLLKRSTVGIRSYSSIATSNISRFLRFIRII